MTTTKAELEADLADLAKDAGLRMYAEAIEKKFGVPATDAIPYLHACALVYGSVCTNSTIDQLGPYVSSLLGAFELAAAKHTARDLERMSAIAAEGIGLTKEVQQEFKARIAAEREAAGTCPNCGEVHD